MLSDLKKFLMRGNVVDLAVAVVIGLAFQGVVNGFVEFIINPLIAAIFGEPDITGVLNWEIREGATLSIGGFLQTVLDFVIIGSALFLVVKAYESMQNRRRSGQVAGEDAPAPSDELVVLMQIRDALQSR